MFKEASSEAENMIDALPPPTDARMPAEDLGVICVNLT